MTYDYTASAQSHIPSRTVSYRIYANGHHYASVAFTAEKGWRFFPLFQAQSSRRFWDTASAATKGRMPKPAFEAIHELERMLGLEKK